MACTEFNDLVITTCMNQWASEDCSALLSAQPADGLGCLGQPNNLGWPPLGRYLCASPAAPRYDDLCRTLGFATAMPPASPITPGVVPVQPVPGTAPEGPGLADLPPKILGWGALGLAALGTGAYKYGQVQEYRRSDTRSRQILGAQQGGIHSIRDLEPRTWKTSWAERRRANQAQTAIRRALQAEQGVEGNDRAVVQEAARNVEKRIEFIQATQGSGVVKPDDFSGHGTIVQ